MAREAGIDWTDFEINGGFNALKTFEALVRADEREQDIQRLSALVRAQQITIDKLEAQRQWVGLTDEEIRNIGLSLKVDFTWEEFARAIEAKLKEKNT
jgi:glycine cleavage system regulatory protein